jgi:hypothetical protein
LYYWRAGADSRRFSGHIRPSNANLVESTGQYYPSINLKCWVDVRTERDKLILQQVLLDTVLLGEGKEQPQFPELYGKEGNLASQLNGYSFSTASSSSLPTSGTARASLLFTAMASTVQTAAGKEEEEDAGGLNFCAAEVWQAWKLLIRSI